MYTSTYEYFWFIKPDFSLRGKVDVLMQLLFSFSVVKNEFARYPVDITEVLGISQHERIFT